MRWFRAQRVLGNLHLSFSHAPVGNYRRELNLNDAIARVEFTRAGVKFMREMFVSAPDQVMVLRLSADHSKEISFEARLDRPAEANYQPDQTDEDSRMGLTKLSMSEGAMLTFRNCRPRPAVSEPTVPCVAILG
jgi:hypothetical protein